MTTNADPTRIVDIAIGYMGAKQLFAASRIGLFAALADGDRDIAEIAAATGKGERIVRILADGMSSLGLLRRDEGRYTLEPDAAAYLAGASAELDLAPFLTFLSEISYPHWLQFDHTVDTGEAGDLGMDEARWGTFMSGVMTYNALHAAMFASALDVTPYRRLLDLGGLAPFFSIGAMRANPELHTTFAFAPDFTASVEQAVADAGLADRSTVTPADTTTAVVEGPFDLVFANHVIHRFSAEENAGIFRNARKSVEPGARLVVLDFFLDDDSQQRSIDAIHAAEYLVIDGTVVYPESQVRGWLTDAGWKPVDVVALPGSPRLLIADAI